MNKVNLREELSCSSSNCFDNSFFTNSLSQEYIAHLSYKGLGTEQNPNIIYPFDKLISEIKPSRIIEIGTFAGGFTLILRTILDNNGLENSIITTYDIHIPTYLLPLIKNTFNIISITKNLFSSDYQIFNGETEESEIVSLIKSSGRILLLCDGGCKKCEFNILSKYLKPGDFIMAHDYAPNREYFEEHMKNKIWNWLEIQDSDIIESCQKYGLVPYMREEFLNVAWACFKKELETL
jgi:cephalosporin hydroxylase